MCLLSFQYFRNRVAKILFYDSPVCFNMCVFGLTINPHHSLIKGIRQGATRAK